jgi:hypothetical protein
VARTTTAVATKDARGVKTYPLVKVERLPPPPEGPALRVRGAQISLWRRLRRTLGWMGVGAAALGTSIVLAATTDIGAGAAAGVFGVATAIWIIVLPISFFAALRPLRIAWRLRKPSWRSYEIQDVRLFRERPSTMTLVHGKDRYPIRIRGSRRAETLRGMIRPQVWFAGDPAGHGLLTVAGGGEIMWAHPNPPRKPRPVRRVGPEKARRRAAKIAARNAKTAERWRKYAEKHPPKPRKPAKPQPVRQPVPPRVPKIRRGQKIKWQ